MYPVIRNGPSLTEGDLLYIAGLFDGEGTAGIYPHARRYDYKVKDGSTRTCYGSTITVAVAMTDRDPVYFLNLCFAGPVHSYQPKKKATYKRVYHWCLNHRQALAFAELILPYSKNQAKVKQL